MEKTMKNNTLLALSILVLCVLTAVSCTAAPQPVTPKPAVQETVKKPELQPPVIKDILGPKTAALSEDTQYTCWANDPDGRKLSYAWSVEAGTVKGTGGREAIWKTPDKPGTYTISVKVTNDVGLEASFSKAFDMVAVPDSHKFTDTTVYLKMSLTNNEMVKAWARVKVMDTSEIQCSVENQDLSDLTIKWTAPIGKLSGSGIAEGKAGRVGWIAPGTPGQYVVGVTITDKNGREVKGEVNLDVYAE
jgi:hypothetical protein